jgi:hypothetical protein
VYRLTQHRRKMAQSVHDGDAFLMLFDGPGRREAARGGHQDFKRGSYVLPACHRKATYPSVSIRAQCCNKDIERMYVCPAAY